MTIDERQLLNARIGELLHVALVTICNATYAPIPEEPDQREEINDLADLLHNLPRYIVGTDEHAMDSLEQLREAVVRHVSKYYPDIDPTMHRYVQVLDMDGEQLLRRCQDNLSHELEPVGTRD